LSNIIPVILSVDSGIRIWPLFRKQYLPLAGDNTMLQEAILYLSDFVNFAWGHLGKTIRWEGEGMDEKGYDSETGNLIVAVDPRYFRPTEVETLLGDPTKAKEKLGWEPKITLEEMAHEMMENDINIAKRDSLVKEHGFKAPEFNE
jgi:GDPmannose 4,6-dehydratase